jgi:hypothetical protein
MCNKCEIFHSNLCQNHQTLKIDQDNSDIFTGFCKEEKHNHMELEFFCKNHNQLCCAACIAKIKTKKIGIHKDCDIYILDDIKDEKKNKLQNNIKLLEELSNTLQDSVNKLKNFFDSINKNKEGLKAEIQKVFTKIRNILNNREDELIKEVDKQFELLYFKESFLKEIDKLPNKVKISLEKTKKINEEYNDKINFFINDCIDIEKNILEINAINENIKKCNNLENNKIMFTPEEEINQLVEKINAFGKVSTMSNSNAFNSSSIINNDITKQNSIIKWIKEKINENDVKFELIFKMSKDGSKAEDFHKKCNDQGPTLIIIKTTKDRIFGGFTPLNWKNKGSFKDENNQTFIFSLNLMKKYDMIKREKDAIKCASYGPNFGDCDIKLNTNLKDGETYANSSCNYLSHNNLELTGGKGEYETFITEEFEVYKVIY